MVVEEAIKGASKVVKSGLVVATGFLAGLPLIVAIPIVLIMLGVGIYLIVTLMPFIVAGAVFILALFLARWLKLPEPWNIGVPVLAGLVAITPYFVHSLSQATLAAALAVSGQEGLSFSITPSGVAVVILFMAMISSGAWVYNKQRTGRPLGLALAVVLLLLAVLPSAIGTPANAGIVSMEGETLLGGISPLLIILPIGIAVIWIAYWRGWFVR